jgi:alanyl-tRNA synthetase
MTELLYLKDPCLHSFKATVTSINGEWVVLDRTAFFPGGGGQEADTGTIDGRKVTETRKEGDVIHRVPDNSIREGQEVGCEVDWARRLDLMRGHTAEHMLFSAISSRLEEAELVKISITPGKKSFIISEHLGWGLVSEVQREVNEVISKDLEVRANWIDRNDLALEGIRAKLDRISGNRVRVISIGNYDIAACAGVHVPSTGKIESILITKMTSAKPPGSMEIEFEVGARAIEEAQELSTIALHASDTMGSHPRDLVKAMENLRRELDRKGEALKRYTHQALESITPEMISGMNVYSGIYPGMDKKTILDAANGLVGGERTVCVLLGVNDSAMMVVARSRDLELDCRKVLEEALTPIGGKGGGKPEFAVGGSTCTEGLESALSRAIDALR